MSGHQHQPPRPVYRTVRAARLLNDLGSLETAVLNAVIELRGVDLDHLADSLNLELAHLQRVRVAAANKLRIEVKR